MNMTPAPEDLLIGDDYDSQLFRNQLLPLWMKIVSYLFVFGAVALAAIFIIFQVEENWSAILAFRGWQDMLPLLLFTELLPVWPDCLGLAERKTLGRGFGAGEYRHRRAGGSIRRSGGDLGEVQIPRTQAGP